MIRPKSFLTILLLTSFDLTISTAQEIGQTNSIDAELERMEDMLGLSSDDAEKIQVAIERVAEEEAGPNQAIFQQIGLNLGNHASHTVMLALFEAARDYIVEEKIDAYVADYEKIEELYCEFQRNNLLAVLDNEFSLNPAQRSKISEKAKSAWTSDWNDIVGRLRFDGFPGSHEIMESIGLLDTLSESQLELYETVRDTSSDINDWPQWAKVPRDQWEPDFREKIELCMKIELEHLEGATQLEEQFQKRFAVVKKKFASDLIKDRAGFFEFLNNEPPGNMMFNRELVMHFSQPPMKMLIDSDVWKKGLKGMVSEEEKARFEENELQRREIADVQGCYAIVCNTFELTRATYSDVEGVYQLARNQLGRTPTNDEPDHWHYYRTFELPDEEWEKHVSDEGWNNIQSNVERMRGHAASARSALEEKKRDEEAEKSR